MKSALMFWGGWEGHEPKTCVEKFAPVLEENGFQVEIADSLSVLEDGEHVHNMDLIVPCWSHGALTEVQEGHLCQAVNLGAGIAGWHGGMGDAFRESINFQYMVGRQFMAHQGGMVDYTVHITQPEDPIMEGLSDFTMHSEQYYMHVDPSNDVLATTTFGENPCPWIAGCEMPVAWKRRFNEGRVFYCSLGHVAADFEVPEAFEIMKRGMLWASR